MPRLAEAPTLNESASFSNYSKLRGPLPVNLSQPVYQSYKDEGFAMVQQGYRWDRCKINAAGEADYSGKGFEIANRSLVRSTAV